MDSYGQFLLSQCNSFNSGVPNLRVTAHYQAMACSHPGHVSGGQAHMRVHAAQLACTAWFPSPPPPPAAELSSHKGWGLLF